MDNHILKGLGAYSNNVRLVQLCKQLWSEHQLVPCDVRGDGTCMLRAIIESTRNRGDAFAQERHAELRKLAVSENLRVWTIDSTEGTARAFGLVESGVDVACTASPCAYAHFASQSTTYLGHGELVALSAVLGVQFEVFEVGGLVTRVDMNDGAVIRLLRVNGNHYMALRHVDAPQRMLPTCGLSRFLCSAVSRVSWSISLNTLCYVRL